MRTSTRATVTATGTLLLGTLTACSGGSGTEPDNQPAPSSRTSQASSGLSIAKPKNASAVPLCSLLPSEVATSLGYQAQGQKRENMLNSDAPPVCEWESPENSATGVTMRVLDRRIADYYANPSTWSDFQKLTIAGHPAVRANQADPMKSGSCDIYLATRSDQMIASQVSVSTAEVGKKDPCVAARKVLEAVVPTLPPAK
ncbi:DUF3558 domain-containing protein [Haloactinomyces albus]|uniref:DUF3558 domain-containing protein n=1 Tax=Haloactinomyces albus TaxID=1352928 RepID=A0AAE4CL19_9ACTN|nr:DUF3558 domain-containing protein [Haloactinomyces albus]MDR7301780.1 hypothetical protein [Haloactinomyces albus]